MELLVLSETDFVFRNPNSVSNVGLWWATGSEADEAWMKLSFWNRWKHELGQTTVSSEKFAKIAHLNPLERATELAGKGKILKGRSFDLFTGKFIKNMVVALARSALGVPKLVWVGVGIIWTLFR